MMQAAKAIGFAMLVGLLVLPAFPLAAAPIPDEELDVADGKQDTQDSYGGRGYAVRYSVPDPGATWWVTSVNIHGESYGVPAPGREFFTISFMDTAGKVYARSEHPKTLFSSQPAWKTIRITPTQVPSEFWVIVDFQSTADEGVFIGVANNGGGHSMLADANCALYPVTAEDNSVRPIDWCIALRLRDKYKGQMAAYDPGAEPLNRPEPAANAAASAQTQSTDHFVLAYAELDDIWGVSVLRLLEAARESLADGYGLALPQRISVQAGADADLPTSIQVAAGDALHWNVRSRTELLPLRRGGTYTHVFCFCRELARLALRHTFPDHRLMPAGLEDGLSSYLAGEAVRHANGLHGQKLWPIQFTYLREEGPDFVREWAAEEPEEPARRHAALLYALEEAVGREVLASMLKGMLAEPAAARGVIKRLAAEAAALEGAGLPEGLFPPDMVDPPFLWLAPEPNLSDMSMFGGLEVKRFKEQVILSYGAGSAGDLVTLSDGAAVIFTTPPGAWRIESVRLFGRRSGSGADAEGASRALVLAVRGREFEPLQAVDVPPASFRTAKPAWNTLADGPLAPALSGPFLIHFQLDPAFPETIEVGCEDASAGTHGFVLFPGSHAEPLPGGKDLMVRVYLSSVSGKEKDELDAVIKDFRQALSP